MRVIIAGSRDISDYSLVTRAVEQSGFYLSAIVSGEARGVDSLGERFAQENGLPLLQFRADWETHGRAAGPLRNRQMAEYADALVAITNGSSGTENMIAEAKKRHLACYVVRLEPTKQR